MKILILEDDRVMRAHLKELLGTDYEVVEAASVQEAESLFMQTVPELCILDVNLKDGNGYEVCRRFRRNSVVPILFVTVRDDDESIIQGLEAGGDDYITKPFSAKQLQARVRALLRRSMVYACRKNECFMSGVYQYDRNRRVFLKGEEELRLSCTEFQIAEYLFLNYGCLVSRERLLEKIWDRKGNFVENNTLTVNISRLRKKLGTFEGVPYIRTVTGIGYRWEVPVTGGVK